MFVIRSSCVLVWFCEPTDFCHFLSSHFFFFHDGGDIFFFSMAFAPGYIHWVSRRSPRELTEQGSSTFVLKFVLISVISEECICQSRVQLKIQLSVQSDIFEV